MWCTSAGSAEWPPVPLALSPWSVPPPAFWAWAPAGLFHSGGIKPAGMFFGLVSPTESWGDSAGGPSCRGVEMPGPSLVAPRHSRASCSLNHHRAPARLGLVLPPPSSLLHPPSSLLYPLPTWGWSSVLLPPPSARLGLILHPPSSILCLGGAGPPSSLLPPLPCIPHHPPCWGSSLLWSLPCWSPPPVLSPPLRQPPGWPPGLGPGWEP